GHPADPAVAAAARAARRARANRVLVAIDAALSSQLDAILHHSSFQRLESLWRGTWWLCEEMEGDAKLRLRILDCRWGEAVRDLERALSFDQSALFGRVYSDEFGTPGGEPFGMIVVDHQLWHRPGGRERTDDVAALMALSEVAAAAFCPFVFGVDPRLAGMDGFDEFDLRQDLAGSFAGRDFAGWDRLRRMPDARFLAAVAPRLLLRPRHRGRDLWRLGFVYDEQVTGPDDLLWLSGGFALAQVAARAMRQHRWPAAIRGAASAGEGGVVVGPARHFLAGDVPHDAARIVVRYPTENAISEEQEIELNLAGIIALRQLPYVGTAAFLNLPSLHLPPNYDGEAARMNAKMNAMLNYIMCVCRFAHFLKVMARDWVGKYTDAKECQKLLNDWLRKYVTGDDDAGDETRRRYPLREARVVVVEEPGKPGSYRCEIALRPHYQLDQIANEFRLTTAIGRETAT
ncbi:hypothetical protein IP88_11650, partial [alpha proteobacterium AAP81b]